MSAELQDTARRVRHARPAVREWVQAQEAVPCRECGAEPGAPCVASSGNPARRPHSARRDDAGVLKRPQVTNARQLSKDTGLMAGAERATDHVKPPCKICGKPFYARNWCRYHYRRWQAYGDPEFPLQTFRSGPVKVALSAEHEAIWDDYTGHLAKRTTLSAQTRRAYASALRGYLAWLKTSAVDGDPLADKDARTWALREYKSHLVTVLKRSPATLGKILAALEHFYTARGMPFAENEHIKRQKRPLRAPRSLDPKATLRYLRAVEAWQDARDQAIALLPLYAGTRVSEIAALDVENVRITDRTGNLHIFGKGEHSRVVPIHSKLREALLAWLGERPSYPGANTPALFIARTETSHAAEIGRLRPLAISAVIHRITAAAGLKDDITVHRLRHTFATRLLREGTDIVSVADLMGHARLDTTRLYTKPTQEDLERAIASLPVDE